MKKTWLETRLSRLYRWQGNRVFAGFLYIVKLNIEIRVSFSHKVYKIRLLDKANNNPGRFSSLRALIAYSSISSWVLELDAVDKFLSFFCQQEAASDLKNNCIKSKSSAKKQNHKHICACEEGRSWLFSYPG